MTQISELAPHDGDGFAVVPLGNEGVALTGTLTLRDPSQTVGPYFRAVHKAALADGLKEVKVDVTRLSFMNSSAIRIFIDWVGWAKEAQAGYTLHFVTNTSVTWQRSTFSAVQALGGSSVRVSGVS